MPTGLYFRGVDQTDEEVQLRMLDAHSAALDTSPFLSRALSPPTSWLAAFTEYVAIAVPQAITAAGAVDSDRFLSLLDLFLVQQV